MFNIEEKIKIFKTNLIYTYIKYQFSLVQEKPSVTNKYSVYITKFG